jgi:hypothetical protein
MGHFSRSAGRNNARRVIAPSRESPSRKEDARSESGERVSHRDACWHIANIAREQLMTHMNATCLATSHGTAERSLSRQRSLFLSLSLSLQRSFRDACRGDTRSSRAAPSSLWSTRSLLAEGQTPHLGRKCVGQVKFMELTGLRIYAITLKRKLYSRWCFETDSRRDSPVHGRIRSLLFY